MVVATGDVRLPRVRPRAGGELDRLYRKHGSEVQRYARLVLHSAPDAEDVTQTVFMRALRALERGERIEKPRNWLIKIAHNECRRVLQARSRRRVEVELVDLPVEQREPGRANDLRRALGHLAPKQREAIVLRELEGRSYAEIASALALSESAVETLIFRARRALREQLDDVVGCDEAALLLEADLLSLDDRRRLRAHTRACAGCASLERRRRGRKGALRRIASTLGLPWWGAKAAVLALGVGAAGTALGLSTGEPHARVFPVTNVAPVVVHRPGAPAVPPAHRLAQTKPALARAPRHRAPATGVARPQRPGPRPGGLALHRPTPSVATAAPAAPTAPVTPAAARPPASAAPPAPAPASVRAPEPSAAAVGPPPPVTLPSVTVSLPAVTVTTPAVTAPALTAPAVTVPLPAASVTLPAVTASLPSVTATLPALTLPRLGP